MADFLSREERSRLMAAIRGRDTKPEMRVRRALHRLGYRFRLHDPTLPGRPDIVLARYGVAIEVRGCFWHGHTCKEGHVPDTRRRYWKAKLDANAARDARNKRELQGLGWRVIIVWECQCRTAKGLDKTLRRLDRALARRLGRETGEDEA